MVKGIIHGQMAIDMKELGKMVRCMVMEVSIEPVERHTWGTGPTVNGMGKGLIHM
jgi:hypothetical protein